MDHELDRVVSGGQTGVDRAALDTARSLNIPTGGWCPKGRRAEDGPIPEEYDLAETPLERYGQRTRWNVRDSDGTLIICQGALEGGTALTADIAGELDRPLHVVDLNSGGAHDLSTVTGWLRNQEIRVLNVAGPRESEHPGIYDDARGYLRDLLMRCAP